MRQLKWVASFFGLFALAAMAPGCVVDPTYTSCFDSNDCEVGEECFEISTSVSGGTFCSNECTSDFDCESNLGFAGSCMNPDGVGGICFQECVFDADCFSTSVCIEFTDADGFFNTVCLPQN